MACLIFTPKEIKLLRRHNSNMKRFLLPLLAALALPTAANAFSFEQKVETCARYEANQITITDAANQLDIKQPLKKSEGAQGPAPNELKYAISRYCNFFKGK